MRLVLYADSKESDQVLVRRAFERYGFTQNLITVGDGDAVIAYLSGRGKYADRDLFPLPALIVLETRLGGRVARDLVQWIRFQKNLRKIPIVIFSSWEMSSDIQEAYNIGVNSYIVKASDPKAFESQVRRVIDFWLRFNVTEGKIPAGLEVPPPGLEKNQRN
ncbi:response regulator [Pedosphaera parvula]|nr:response regulator [Pedosphaera parvula]